MLSTTRSTPRPGVIPETITGPIGNGSPVAIAPDIARPPAPANPQSQPLYACPECGHLLRVSGLGRHRVYFELDDERSDHPVMNRVCPQCGHGLPGKNPR